MTDRICTARCSIEMRSLGSLKMSRLYLENTANESRNSPTLRNMVK